MPQFMLMYRADAKAEEVMGQATPEEMQAGMAQWFAWRDKVGADNLDFGLPVQPRVHVDQDGSATESTSDLSGYSILTADSLDDAVRLVADHPHLSWRGGTIEILELLPMPGP
jgi:hypothetical protein